jgi:hypothetical protein
MNNPSNTTSTELTKGLNKITIAKLMAALHKPSPIAIQIREELELFDKEELIEAAYTYFRAAELMHFHSKGSTETLKQTYEIIEWLKKVIFPAIEKSISELPSERIKKGIALLEKGSSILLKALEVTEKHTLRNEHLERINEEHKRKGRALGTKAAKEKAAHKRSLLKEEILDILRSSCTAQNPTKILIEALKDKKSCKDRGYSETYFEREVSSIRAEIRKEMRKRGVGIDV